MATYLVEEEFVEKIEKGRPVTAWRPYHGHLAHGESEFRGVNVDKNGQSTDGVFSFEEVHAPIFREHGMRLTQMPDKPKSGKKKEDDE